MGNPYEHEFWAKGYRDPGQGEPRAKDLVYDPACDIKESPAKKKELDDFWCRFRKETQRTVFFVKKPANIEPPWFSKPLFKSKCGLVVAAGATETIFSRVIEDRTRAMVTMIGVDVAPIAPLLNCQLEFWFAQGGDQRTDIIPVFDDQTPTTYGGTTPLQAGKTTTIPGSVGNPFCLMSNGMQFRVKGRKELTFNVENKSGVPVTIRGLLGLYSYWLPYGATEFESGDVQL